MLKQILLLIITSVSVNAYGETLESLHVNSTDLIIDRQKMTATFSGKVMLCFQGVKLLGNKAIFYFVDDKIKDIKSIKVHGGVKGQEKDGSTLLADDAFFELSSSTLKLTGDVIIERGQNIMYSKEIVYKGKISTMMLGQ